jgi:4-amino-4-deoxy-L-arabinose transferase-like glycosyltransferase
MAFVSGNQQRSAYRPSISLVLPAFNEQAVIEQAVTEAVTALSQITDDFEVLVVDDGSIDATAEIVTRAAERFPQVRLLRQEKNLGYGAALRRGFSETTKELVGFTDADCQFDLTELDRLVFLARDYQIVCGYRIDRKDSWLRCTYSAGYNMLVRALLGTQVRDCDCALKLFHREALEKLPITGDGFLVNGEMLATARQQGISLVEVGVSHRPRAAGESKVSILHIPVVFAALIRFWWNRVMFAGSASENCEVWSQSRRVLMSAVLLAAASLLLFINLNYALIEPDESRYAQIALEMYESGDWLVPRLGGEPYLDKPPLLYWLMATSYSCFGVSETSARLPCALAGLATVLAVYWIGRGLVGDRAAWYGALLLLACGGFVAAGRFIMMDGLLTLLTTVCYLAAVRAMFASDCWRWWLISGIACGLGVLTKGPVAPVLCLPPLIALAWLGKDYRLLGLKTLAAFFLPVFAIASPWFFAISAEQSEFVGYFFWKHNVVRYVDAFDHQQPWWFYLPMLALGIMPSTLLLPGLAAYLGTHQAKVRELRSPELGSLLLAAVWIVGFFSLSSCKLVTYILPAFPLLALSLGKMFNDAERLVIAERITLKKLTHGAAWFTVSTISWVSIGASVVVVMLNPHVWPMVVVFCLLPVITLTLLYGKWLREQRHVLAAAVGVYVVVAIYGFGFVVPEFAEWRSVMRSAAKLQRQMNGAPVVFFGTQGQGAALAVDGHIVEFNSQEAPQFEAFMRNHPAAVVVVNRSDLAVLQAECADTLTLEGPRARSRVYVATRREIVAERLEVETMRR